MSLLVGRAIGDGLVEFDTPIDDVLGGQWTPGGQRAGITVEHLLAMTSGLDDRREVVAPPGGAVDLQRSVRRPVRCADDHHRARPRRRGAGMALRSGRSVELIVLRTPGRPFAPTGLRSTVPDLIAIGQLVLDGGPPGLVDGWLDRSFTPSQAFNRSYGLLWWLDGQESFMLPGPDAQFPA